MGDLKVKKEKTDNRRQNKLDAYIYRRRFSKAYEYLVKKGMDQKTLEIVFGCRNSLKQSLSEEQKLDKLIAEASLEMELVSHMLAQAVGYDYEETKTESIKDPKDKTKWVEVKKTVNKKRQPGNAAMFIFMMTNKFRENWKSSREVVSKKENYDANPSDRNRKQIECLARDILEANPNESSGEHSVQDKVA